MKEKASNTWLSIGAFARAYGYSRNTVKKWLAANLLEVQRFQGLTRIRNRAPELHQPTKPSSSGDRDAAPITAVSTL